MPLLSLIIILIGGLIFYFYWFKNNEPINSEEEIQEKHKKNIHLNKMKYETELSQELIETDQKSKEKFDMEKKKNKQLLISNYWRKRNKVNDQEVGRIPSTNYRIDNNKLPKFNAKDFWYSFNKNNLVLLTRDPKWIYAYWNIKGLDTDKTKPLLRIYDITNTSADKSKDFFDIEITPEATDWYIKVPSSNKRYYAQIGLLTHNNIFISLANSNPVIIPTDEPAKEYSNNWMTVNGTQRKYVSYKPESSLNYPSSTINKSSASLIRD